MPDYRLYCLEGAGRIHDADWIEAANDEEAIAAARELKRGALQCEIWLEQRLVTVLKAEDLSG